MMQPHYLMSLIVSAAIIVLSAHTSFAFAPAIISSTSIMSSPTSTVLAGSFDGKSIFDATRNPYARGGKNSWEFEADTMYVEEPQQKKKAAAVAAKKVTPVKKVAKKVVVKRAAPVKKVAKKAVAKKAVPAKKVMKKNVVAKKTSSAKKVASNPFAALFGK